MKCKVDGCDNEAAPLVVHLADGDVTFDFCAEHSATLQNDLDIPQILTGSGSQTAPEGQQWLVTRMTTGESWCASSTEELAGWILRNKVVDTDLTFHPWVRRWVSIAELPAIKRKLELAAGIQKRPTRIATLTIFALVFLFFLFVVVKLVRLFWYL